MSESPIIEARDAMIAAGELRADSKMRNLSEAHFEQVVGWLLDATPPAKVAQMCKQELGLPPSKAPSQTALYSFWGSFGAYWLSARRRSAARAANAAGEAARQSPADWERANADIIQQLTFEILSDPNFNPKTAKSFISATLKLRDQDLAAQKIELMRQKLGEAKQILEATKSAGQFTDADRAAVLAAVDEAMGLKKR
jgi:hypothetical protein